MRAKDVMISAVVTVRSQTPARYAAQLLVTHGFTALAVVDDDNRLLGIVTEADLLHDRFAPDPRTLIHNERPAPATRARGRRRRGDGGRRRDRRPGHARHRVEQADA
jgi:CBS-domain-containing membrane protein